MIQGVCAHTSSSIGCPTHGDPPHTTACVGLYDRLCRLIRPVMLAYTTGYVGLYDRLCRLTRPVMLAYTTGYVGLYDRLCRLIRPIMSTYTTDYVDLYDRLCWPGEKLMIYGCRQYIATLFMLKALKTIKLLGRGGVRKEKKM